MDDAGLAGIILQQQERIEELEERNGELLEENLQLCAVIDGLTESARTGRG